ncbi:MAG: hypothetical protein KBG28_28215 [Kofleriaceae bacterium]|nr:hypothetical protein [Kofleriaceae bacterium]MBP6836251.1 hypothetical protein [Kofleriaceae bacterium]MBP9207883.1 hypothetical protein [Kofleriaceae bacterium]
MPQRPDLRQLTSNVRDAFADADRDTLLDVLAFVVREYVVEGPPPMLVHAVEDLADLGGMSFAQLITALQTRLPQPELALFTVDGEQVSVRVGGVAQPLVVRPGGGAPAEPSRPPAEPRPQAGVRVVETASMPRPAANPAPAPAVAAAPAAAPAAPRPTGGLSVRGRPSGDAPAPASAPAAPSPASAAPGGAAPAPAPEAGGGGGGGGDDSAARFSLLELD